MSIFNDIFNFASDLTKMTQQEIASRKLIKAAENNDLFAIKDILKQGAHINKPNGEGDTALILAVRRNRTAIVQFLLDNGASVDHANHRGETALIASVKYGDIKTVTALLDKTKDIDKRDGYYKENALHIAARRGFTAIVALLIEKGARLDLIDGKGDIPLKAAQKNNRPEVITLLQNATEERERIAAAEKLRQQLEATRANQNALKNQLANRPNSPRIRRND